MPQSLGPSSCWPSGALWLRLLLLSSMTPLLPEPPKAAELAARTREGDAASPLSSVSLPLHLPKPRANGKPAGEGLGNRVGPAPASHSGVMGQSTQR